ncbi:MAG: metallophosphoesterase, partial [Epsilonproteobacteria bacterium]|nr:metallophosphoesterase [Campylobacterota bacterium]
PYLSGLYRHSARTQVFVSNGAGYWGPPVRVMAPSEIVILRLKAKV